VRYVMGRLTSTFTLTDTTALQRAFSFGSNGAIDMAEGLWAFSCHIHITGMSATSGNARFQLVAGTAVLAAVSMRASGFDNTTPTNAGAQGGSYTNTLLTVASMVTAGTGTGLTARVEGLLGVTTGGTVIPSVQLVTGGVTPAMQPGSFFFAQRIGASADTTIGAWT